MEIKELTEEQYYADNQFLNFSALKIFSKCEVLYKDTFLVKTYQPPDKEYFTYGKIVDCLLTTPDKFDEMFIRVERTVKEEKALEIENEIKGLQAEIVELTQKMNDGDGRAKRSITAREKKLGEAQANLESITKFKDKIQVTPSLWKNAFETAEAIKSHPFFGSLEFNEFTSQQSFATTIDGIPTKGRLDYLELSQPVFEMYKLWKTGQITADQMKERITLIPEAQRKAAILDIKSCYDLSKLEPFNYRNQLSFYRRLVLAVLGIKADCYILAGDKAGEFKKVELFKFSDNVLDDILPDIEEWSRRWFAAVKNQTFVSAKAKEGFKQECYSCSECRNCPFSIVPGQPVMINAPRFDKTEGMILQALSKGEPTREEY